MAGSTEQFSTDLDENQEIQDGGSGQKQKVSFGGKFVDINGSDFSLEKTSFDNDQTCLATVDEDFVTVRPKQHTALGRNFGTPEFQSDADHVVTTHDPEL